MLKSLCGVLIGVAAALAVSVRQQSVPGELLPVAFSHADHREVNCIRCHHDFADRSGNGFCLDCHHRDPSLNPLIEDHFHDLCRGCHVEERGKGEDAGPVRACIDCHHQEDEP